MVRLLLTVLVCAAVTVLASARGFADDKTTDSGDIEAAKKHFRKAEKLFELGRFQDALKEYEAAYEAKALPELLFNIGQCHRNLGDYRAAAFQYKLYLRKRPDAPNRDAVNKLIEEVEQKLAAEEAAQKERERRERERKLVTPTPPPEAPPAQQPTPPPPSKPVYKRWWFWTGITVAAAAAGGTAFVLTNSGGGIPSSDLGNIEFD